MNAFAARRASRGTNAASRFSLVIAAAVVSASVGAAAFVATKLLAPGPKQNGTGITPEGWRITPAGRQTALGPGPLAVTVTPDGSLVLVADAGFSDHALLVIDASSGEIRQKLAGADDGSKGYYAGLAVSKNGKRAYASDGAGSGVRTYRIAGGQLTEGDEIALDAGSWPAGLALSKDGSRLYAAGNLADDLISIDAVHGTVLATTPVGHLPYGVELRQDGARAYVSNWGADTITVVDTDSGRALDTITVGAHPSALVHSPTSRELYVANTDSDDVSVIDTHTSRVVRTIDLRPFAGAPVGSSPNALAVSPDGDTLYVANAGSNSLSVVRLAGPKRRQDVVAGQVPTGWYPSGVALDPRAATLFVINMKGLGVGPVAPDQYIGAMLAGTLSTIPVPSEGQLLDDTKRVWQNTLFAANNQPGVVGKGNPIPEKVGGSSPIEHVIYVMKENRTYDQVLGDLPGTNGDSSLAIFGKKVTPNYHELSRRFVAFDNFYCDGEVSADGWTWSNAANANTYNQKNWPLDYGYSGRLYDFGGFGDSTTAAFPGKNTGRPFLWDRLADNGVSYRNYGFFVNGAPVVIDSSMPGLVGHTDLDYPGWDLDVPDQVRVDAWLQEFRGFEASGRMPSMQFVYFPRDHTVGTSPGAETPAAMVADGDLAVGRLVEAVSHSRFWPSTAIFAIEDDAQDGPDHVDGHRTVALAISPYTQKARLDSTFYSTVSMLRTMELIVGIGPMTQFDALATPMSAAFDSRPNLAPYTALTPEQSLTEVSLASAPLSQMSAKLDFSRPDAANHRLLNQAIWHSVKRGTAYPAPRRSTRLTAMMRDDDDG